MEDLTFTEEEKRIIARVLFQQPKRVSRIFAYGSYILPSLLFAGFGAWRHDFVAELVAYLSLLVVALIYVQYSLNSSYTLYSTVAKYEEQVGALQQKIAPKQ